MYVFRHPKETASSSELLSQTAAELEKMRPDAPGVSPLLAAGRLECAVADYFSAEVDDEDEPRQRALQLVIELARLYVAAKDERPAADSVHVRGGRSDWRNELGRLQWLLPSPGERLTVSESEGFRYYALFPERYVTPARELARTLSLTRVCVIGLRTIGSVLGPVVAAALEREGVSARVLTVRPRGAPFDRVCRVAPALERQLAGFKGDFVVVDEGPGLSGSSFIGAANWLRSLGVGRERITLMPSWNPESGQLVNDVARREWEHWRKLPAEALRPPVAQAQDLSAGKWREFFPTACPVPVWAQHERAKFLSPSGECLFKFAGLGSYGAAQFERARHLSAYRFGPPVNYNGDGWLHYHRVEAVPLRPDVIGPGVVEWLGRYLAFLRANYSLGSAESPSGELRAMARSNLELLLRRQLPALPPDAVPVALDGRMLPHEFGYVNGELIKFDGVEHGDDHFFPGPTDIAWDVAAIETEFGPSLGEATADEYMRLSGDNSLRKRLPWFRVAYTTFRAAWTRFAAERVGEPDRTLFEQQHRRYLMLLSRLTSVAHARA